MTNRSKSAVCPNCKQPATGNYCSNCGAQLVFPPLSSLTHYSDIIKDKRCKQILEKETERSDTGMSADRFWQIAQLVLPTRMPLSLLAAFTEKAGEKLNMGRKSYGMRLYHHPYSYTVLALLTALARRSLTVKKVQDADKRCLIEAHIPSSIWNLEGRLEAIVVGEGAKTKVLIEARIHGQWMDWGITQRLIDGILGDMEKLSGAFEEVDFQY